MPLSYYIDGYNVIHHAPDLRERAQGDFESARDLLIERVARFCAASQSEARIVFDGRGRRADPVQPFRAPPGLEVIYSPNRQSADALIERMVYQTTERREIVVVSADRGIRELCQGLGTLVMTPHNFLETVQETLERDQAGLEYLRRHHRRYTVEDWLDPDSREQLDALKRRLEE